MKMSVKHGLLAGAALLLTSTAAQATGGDRFVVTTGADSGKGSLRAALAAAEASKRGKIVIRIAPKVDAIELKTGLTYSGKAALVFRGRGATLTAVNDAPIVLLTSNSAADLTFRNLAFDGGQSGLIVNVPADAKGVVDLDFRNVIVTNSAGWGVLVEDQVYNSDAGVSMTLRNVEISNTGFDPAVIDEDGIRINEGGFGDIEFSASRIKVIANAADGIELDETDRGSVLSVVRHSAFIDNGLQPQNADPVFGIDPLDPDLEDGFDIDEAGNGDIVARFVKVVSSDNFDGGIDLDEAGDGDMVVTGILTSTNFNGDEGYSLTEEDNGSALVRLVAVEAEGNLSEGFEVVESEEDDGDGDVAVRIVGSVFNDNGNIETGEELNAILAAATAGVVAIPLVDDGEPVDDQGLQIEEFGKGDLGISFVGVESSGNSNDGLNAAEAGAGDLAVRIVRSAFTENGDDGLAIEQADEGEGFVIVRNTDVSDNADDDINFDGVVSNLD